MSRSICKWYPVCPMKRFYDAGLLAKKWVDDYCFGNWQRCIRFEMEKLGRYHPENMLPDGSIDQKIREK